MAFHGRGKNKIQSPDNLVEIYQKYIEDKDEGSPYFITQAQFIAINNLFYKGVVEKVLEGQKFDMPSHLGAIFIEKKKAPSFRKSKRFIDWKTTMEVGQLVYHLNEHTNGFNYFIRWVKNNKIKYDSKYRFIPTRNFRRTLAQIIKSKQQDYFEK